VATVALSCRQIVGFSDTQPSHPSTTSACGLPYGTTACAACAQANCCSESSGCAGDPVCEPYESCLGACSGDPACRSRCAIEHPTGKASDLTSLSVCLASKCETECGLTCGGLAGWPVEPDAAAACQDCFETNACDQGRACATSADCDAIHRCMLACPTDDCRQACQTSHGLVIDRNPSLPTGVGPGADAGPFPAFDAVRRGVCATACATGGYWECVGKVSWPAPAPSTTIHFWASDLFSSVAIGGMQISVCGLADFDCTTPTSMGTTNDAGEVSLVVPQSASGGHLAMTAPPYYSNPNYWSFPLSEAQWFTWEGFSTPAEGAQFSTGLPTPDPARGYVDAWVFDCLGDPAPGVKVSISTADSETIAGTFSQASVSASNAVTDSRALVGFRNVPLGLTIVTAEPLAIGRISGQVADIPVLPIEDDGGANVGAFVHLYPTPLP
jgi:hypothetical protein